MIGFMLGALAAAAWAVAADRLSPDAAGPQPLKSEPKPSAPPSTRPQGNQPRQQSTVILIEKPLIAHLRESDVMRTLGGILTSGGIPDVTRLGWPTLRMGFASKTFLDAMREMRAPLAKPAPAQVTPVMAVIGARAGEDRSIAALNIALAAARDGAKVLMIDADHATHALSNKVTNPGKREAGGLGWLGIGAKPLARKPSRAIETANGISILPAIQGADAKSSDAIRRAIDQARSAGGYDLVILEGPAMPWSAADRGLLDLATGLVAILPANLDINDCLEDIITALGGAERKLVGVVLSELHPTAADLQREKQYA
jgi:Mrp family chromosome partitioning ATPase